jgi:iron complex outermembrane receptor protein
MFLLLALLALAQPSARIDVHVRSAGEAVAGAVVSVNRSPHTAGADGRVTVTVPAGAVHLAVERDGFFPARASLTLEPGETRELLIELEARQVVEEHITVTATRTERGLDDQPTRVEVLDRDEIVEKLLMTPGDIVMMLNEMGGLRVQATSPSLGAASVRVQGLRGRYTRVLSDGLPLFGAEGGALSLLQIPPTDLGQVEVIKGNASALYGAGAIGGVVNLISRRPPAKAERELLFNRSTRGATDAVLWWAGPLSKRWGMTLLGGGHGQTQTDVDGDGWADLPGYARGVFRPRFFWDSGDGKTLLATTGLTYEDRTGGTLPGRTLPATGAEYREAIETLRVDLGAAGQILLAGRYVLSGRLALSEQRHDHRFGQTRERDRHESALAEVSVRGTTGRHTWVGGGALERDAYRPRDVPRFAYTYTVPGLFVHDEMEVRKWLSVAASARLDHHNAYGTFFSPRVSALFRSGAWSSRVSAGSGFFGPSALTEETEAAGLTRLTIARPLRAERGDSASFDLTRTQPSGAVTATLFASRVRHPLQVDRSDGLRLTNLADSTTNLGAELLATWRRGPWAVAANYAFIRSREGEEGLAIPLTPRHSAGIDGVWKNEKGARVGFEFYYTGVQRLEENPYRDRSKPYLIVGVLVEAPVGPFRFFINGENLTGVRQTRWDPLLRPRRAGDGRWTVDAWAPLEGRNINGGFRLRF